MIALDIFIGLVLIYFLYALLVSIIAEMISTWIGLRARLLRQGIDNILNDKTPGVNNKKDFTNWIKDIFVVEPKEFKYSLAGRFYKEPTIKYLAKTGENEVYSIRNTKPAYISKENFTLTILNMLSRRTQGIHEWDKIKFAIKHNAIALEPETFKMFQDWMDRSNDQYGNFITNVERTYEEMMDRVNGWYKRKIGLFIFWIGFAICVIMNVDTFEIVKILANSPDKAKAMAELAIDVVNAENNYRNDTTRNDSIKNNTASLNLINAHYQAVDTSIKRTRNILANGWVFPDSIYTKKFLIWQKSKHLVSNSRPFGIKFWGIVITALALSLGSQFWFDLLKKLVSLRGAGVKPEERDSELKKEMAIKKNGNDGLAVTTKDPVQIAIAENREYWESLPGVYGINPSIYANTIDLVIDEKLDYKLLGNNPLKVKILSKEIDIKINTIKGTPAKILDGDGGYINIEGLSKKGAISGIFRNIKNETKCFLTCAHVLQRNDTSYIDRNNSGVNFDDKKIGSLTNLIASSYIDAAVVDCESIPDKLKEYGISEIKHIIKIDNKNLSSIEMISSKIIRNNITNTIAYEFVNDTYSYNFASPTMNKYMYDLIVLKQKANENPQNILAEPGDSGSLIRVKLKNSDTEYSYAMLNGTFSILNTLTNKTDHYVLAIDLSIIMSVLNLKIIN